MPFAKSEELGSGAETLIHQQSTNGLGILVWKQSDNLIWYKCVPSRLPRISITLFVVYLFPPSRFKM